MNNFAPLEDKNENKKISVVDLLTTSLSEVLWLTIATLLSALALIPSAFVLWFLVSWADTPKDLSISFAQCMLAAHLMKQISGMFRSRS